MNGPGTAPAEVSTAAVVPTRPRARFLARRKLVGSGLTALTGLAALLVVAMLGVILWDVIRGGAGRVSWEFLTTAPTEGMTGGGIFPAIYGTALLTLVMTVAVMPVGVSARGVMLTVGVVMGVVFQLAHISGDADFPEPVGTSCLLR